MRLEGKKALVTGASGGLGTGICEAFAREGADCLVGYRSDREGAEKTAEIVKSFGRRAVIFQADTPQEDQVKAMVQAAVDDLGGLDIVVANAGVGSCKPLMQTTAADFEKLIRVNLIGTYQTVRYGAEPLAAQKHGKIITVSSVHGLGGTHWVSLYEATKAGIINFTRGAAFDLAEHNIQINALAPGAVPVPKDPPPEPESDIHHAWMRYMLVPRWGTPGDIGAGAVYLASSDSDWVTGQVISIDGGITAGPHMPSFVHYNAEPKKYAD